MPQPSTILDHPLVSSRYFFPRHEAFPNPYWVDAADGSKLACSYHVVNPDAITVVYFHGNGEVVADYLPGFPNWLTRAGYNVLLAEYRGYGMSTGQPALVGMLEDVSAIMRSLNIPDRRLVLFGRSIGSLYAVHGVSGHPQLAGVILESGIAALTERFFMRVQPEELGMPRTALLDELQRHFDYVTKLGVFRAERWYCIPGTTNWSRCAMPTCSMPRRRSRKHFTSSTREGTTIFSIAIARSICS